MITTSDILESMQLSEELALEYFVTFARFEYAMIAAGFVHSPRGRAAEADWNALIACLGQKDVGELRSVLSVGTVLAKHPPKRLNLVDGSPKFESVRRDGQSDIRFLIESVKRARNNLFHGGKFLTPPTPAERNTFVVTEALAVLKALLGLPALAKVRQAFDDVPR